MELKMPEPDLKSIGIAIFLAGTFVANAHASGYVTFVDPHERAFSIEVPRGWTVTGGLLRYSPLSYNFVMRLDSPDGRHIKVGDETILPFTAPAPGLPPPGSRYPVGQGVVMIVAPYMDGAQFAQRWGSHVLGGICPNALRLRSSSRVSSPSSSPSSSSGQAVFDCGNDIAYVFATTTVKPGPALQWEATDAIIGLAPASGIRDTVDVIYHMIGSARINPQWMMAQLQNSGVAMSTAREQTQALMQQQERTSINTPGSASYALDQAVRGYSSTPGGAEVEQQGNGGYYWNCNVPGFGNRQVNTQSYMSPGPNCTRIR